MDLCWDRGIIVDRPDCDGGSRKHNCNNNDDDGDDGDGDGDGGGDGDGDDNGSTSFCWVHAGPAFVGYMPHEEPHPPSHFNVAYKPDAQILFVTVS